MVWAVVLHEGFDPEFELLAGGVWRVAFAFDPARRAVLLVAAARRAKARAGSTER
jgi:hypothetical protein